MEKKTKAQKTGDFGEEVAASLMRKKGFSIVERNYRSRYGEIDIIASDEQYIIFVEVKTRSTSAFGTPSLWVDKSKQKKITKTAFIYLESNQSDLQPRFDVVEVICDNITGAVVHTEHIENAFDVSAD